MATGAPAGAPIMTASFDAAALDERRVEPASPGRPSRGLVGCGPGLPEQQLLIVDPATLAACPPGRVGEIWLRGPSISRGYWGWSPGDNQPVFAARMAGDPDSAFLRTGDLGFLHRGELFVAGRLKDVLLVRGRTLYPQDLERTIESSHPGFRPGCCAAFSVEQDGEEQVVAVQEVSGANSEALEAVARQALRAVAREHGVHLHQLVLIKQGSIQKTSSGKIQRFACRAAYLDGSLDVLADVRPPPPRAAPPESHFLLDEIGRLSAIPVDQIDLDATVLDAGLDSLQLAELKQVYEARAGSPVDAWELMRRPLRELLGAAPASAAAPTSGAGFTVEWDLAQAAPALLEELCRKEPWLRERYRELRGAIPVPSTNGTFEEPGRFRPAGHFRAFYLRGPGESVVAVKGADLRCEDQTGFLQVLHQRSFERFARHSVTNVLEYFLLQEHKVPGALLVGEGVAEAKAAARVQSAFLDQYGALGDLPVPLLVVRWSDEVVARFCDRLLPLLSGNCLGIARDEIARGLGCYLYYFPKPPAPRVSHFAGSLAAESHRTGAAGVVNTRLVHATLAHNFDPGSVVDSWIRLVARMLCLGFFPADAKHFKNGQSIEPQNVLLNGSFADLDSVTSMEGLDDRDFYSNLLCTLNLLANTIRVFLTAENNGTTAAPAPFPHQFPKPDFLEIVILVHLWERLKVHAAEARAGTDAPPDPRLEEVLGSGMSFPVLFDKILYAIYYQGPRIPESALHLVGVTDVYSEVAPEETRPTQRLQYDARIQLDAAALATIPRSFLDRLEISAAEFVRSFMKDDAALVDIYDTFLGRIGLVIIPVEDAAVYVDTGRTLVAVERGLELAARQGAAVVSLTGLIPSATDYGRRIAQHLGRRSGPSLPPFTTGHATTIASFGMAVEKALASAGRSLRDEDVALLGLGSIGGGMLELLLKQLPHPRSLRLVELAARRDHLQQMAARAKGALGFGGELTTVELNGQALTREISSASLIISATSVPNVVEAEQLRPGTIVVDDSAPHCLDPRRAIRRFQQRRDLLVSEAGAVRSNRAIGEISDTHFSTGWDHKVRAALKVVHPNEHTLMGCVLSSLLTARFPDLGCQVGMPEEGAVSAHYLKLKELGFEGSHLYFQDHVLDPGLVRMFRAAFSSPRRPM
jgi:aryl carrier-like protein